MLHRIPSTEKIHAAIGWAPERSLEDILARRDRVRARPVGDGRMPIPALGYRKAGNSTTSRIVSRPVSSITKRSIPKPSPPVGGIPYERAST